MTKLRDAGLQSKLPETNIFIKIYHELMKISHPTQFDAINNYTSTVSRTFKYVDDHLMRNGTPARHWSDLLSYPEEINEFLDKCVNIRYIGRLILNIMFYFFMFTDARNADKRNRPRWFTWNKLDRHTFLLQQSCCTKTIRFQKMHKVGHQKCH